MKIQRPTKKIVVGARLTAEESKKLRRIATERKLSASEMIRELVRKAK